jgi:hypothetical protein
MAATNRALWFARSIVLQQLIQMSPAKQTQTHGRHDRFTFRKSPEINGSWSEIIPKTG